MKQTVPQSQIILCAYTSGFMNANYKLLITHIIIVASGRFRGAIIYKRTIALLAISRIQKTQCTKYTTAC